MPSTYTTRNRAEKQAPGENNNSWGELLNDGTIDMFDQALDGMVSFTLSTTRTLSTANGVSDEARCRYINITGGTGGTVTIPNAEKVYVVRNAASGTVTFTTGSGTTATVLAGNTALVVCEGGNVVRSAAANQTFDLTFLIDGGGAVISTGVKGDLMVDFPFAIQAATALADQTGTIIIDIWKDTYANFPPTDADSITSATPPGMIGAIKGADTTLTGWTTAIAAGSILRFNVDACSAITRCTLILKCVRT